MTTIYEATHAAEAAVTTETNRLNALRDAAVRINRDLETNHGNMEELRVRLERELAACQDHAKVLNAQLAENGRRIHAQQERVAKAQLLADTARDLEIPPEEPDDLNVLGQPERFEAFEQTQTRPDVRVASGPADTQQMPPVGEGQ